jgi:hypothetical protein
LHLVLAVKASSHITTTTPTEMKSSLRTLYALRFLQLYSFQGQTLQQTLLRMSPPGRDEYQDFDDEDTIVLAVPEPEFANTRTTEDEKIEAIKKWVLGRED